MQTYGESSEADEITRVLHELRDQPDLLRERLFPLLYKAMRQIASRQMHAEYSERTLQPTALVHEAYIRLVRAEPRWENRAHFLACASKVMRDILVDYARRRISQKRGAGAEKVQIDEFIAARAVSMEDILSVDSALDRLKATDPLKAELLQLRFFSGMTINESAEALGIGLTATKEHFRLAKAWMHRELGRRTGP